MENRKRKPLSDITNTHHNLIPTSILRKLVASSTNSNSISKPPLRSNSSSTKLCTIRSEPSIGSSSNTSASRCSRTVQFRTTPPRSKGDVVSKNTSNRRMQNVDKSNNKLVAGVVTVTPTAVEKRKDKGKAVAVPLDSPQSVEINDIEQAKFHSFHELGKVKQKDKECGYRTLNPTSYSYGKTDKGNAIPSSSSCSTSKTEEIGKDIGKYLSGSLEKTTGKDKLMLGPSGSSIQRSREIGKNILNSSRFLVERNSKKGKALNPFGSSRRKTKEKGKAILEPSETFEVAKHASGGVNIPPPKNISEITRTYSRSATPKAKSRHFDLEEAGNAKSSKSWTDPNPKIRKKRCSREKSPMKLPQDFIQQQKAYFQEIDAFELQEEEASEDEVK